MLLYSHVLLYIPFFEQILLVKYKHRYACLISAMKTVNAIFDTKFARVFQSQLLLPDNATVGDATAAFHKEHQLSMRGVKHLQLLGVVPLDKIMDRQAAFVSAPMPNDLERLEEVLKPNHALVFCTISPLAALEKTFSELATEIRSLPPAGQYLLFFIAIVAAVATFFFLPALVHVFLIVFKWYMSYHIVSPVIKWARDDLGERVIDLVVGYFLLSWFPWKDVWMFICATAYSVYPFV